VRPSQQRLGAVLVLSAVIVVVLGLIVYTEQVNATATVSVLELTHDVTAGALYTPGDVEQVQIRASGASFNYETQSPQTFSARYAVDLAAHDILRDDDLIPTSSQSEVAITVVNPPAVDAGDAVDVYATLPSGAQALIGHDLVVVSQEGGSLTVLVPASDEASWVAVSSASVALHVARTVVGVQLAPSPLDTQQALELLCGSACAALPSP
jgi:hypothetical protein